MPKGRFKSPPINEVVCGVIFEDLALDPVDVGVFWESVREKFPRKQVLPAIPVGVPDGLVLDLGPMPKLRTWLISRDDTRIMQLQSDRVYLNWRQVGNSAYPSFNASDDQPGLLVEVLEALATFESFVKRHRQQHVKPIGIEMTMIDVLRADRHWSDVKDLVYLLPSLHALTIGMNALPEMFQTVVEGRIENGTQRVMINRAMVVPEGIDAIRVETTIRLGLQNATANVERVLREAHARLKQVFDELIPHQERFEPETTKGTS